MGTRVDRQFTGLEARPGKGGGVAVCELQPRSGRVKCSGQDQDAGQKKVGEARENGENLDEFHFQGRRFVFDLGGTGEVILASIKGKKTKEIPICLHKNHQLLNRKASICLQMLDRCTSEKLDSNI